MRFPNWIKISWWALVSVATTWFLYRRYPALVGGTGTAADIVAFVVWVALLLAPIFQEVGLFGVVFKQQIEALKEKVAEEAAATRAELHNAIAVHTTVSPQFNFPLPPSDAQLPRLEEVAKRAAAEVLQSHGAPRSAASAEPKLAEELQYLFATRYSLEREVFRIASVRGVSSFGPRVVSITQMLRALVEVGLLSPALAQSVREVYAVCSEAMHGQDNTAEKIPFVPDVAPDLVAALRAI
jgi:hypothetical protein